ncbi:MAG TPA: hypothetical protein DDW65_11700 [Firmicutes bacterium]|jgi:hypothetical protein|nr:hypothetical protein [Bacillota bacterium]
MDISLKSRFYFSSKLVMVLAVALIILLSTAATIFASPFMDDPGKLVVFFSHEYVGSGSASSQDYDSFSGTFCGIGIPTKYGSFGIKTTFDTSVSYYEFFADWVYNDNLLMEMTINHLDKDGTAYRFGAYRAVPIDMGDGRRLNTIFGPGISVLASKEDTTFSMFLRAKANYYLVDSLYLFGNGMYDFMFNSFDMEFGVGFSY